MGTGAEKAPGALARQGKVGEGEDPRHRAQQSSKARGRAHACLTVCLHTYVGMEELAHWPGFAAHVCRCAVRGGLGQRHA